ncbi:MAG: TIGR00730 family Rossman fold protein [Methylocystis sp.]
MQLIRTICLYCGSATGNDPAYLAAAESFGRLLAQEKIGLVYGGASCGLMGAAAKAALSAGGRVIGVIPDFFDDREIVAQNLTELIIVKSMHERKQIMFDRADAFVALPGGIGTLEELAEQLTWIQLARHDKPVLIADISGFWRPLLTLMAHMRNMGFIKSSHEISYLVAERVEEIIPMILKAASHRKQPINSELIGKF